MLEEGLPKGVKNLKPLEMILPNDDKLKITVMDVIIGNPRVNKDAVAKTMVVYPSECRMRETSYKSKLGVTFAISVNGQVRDMLEETVGEIPIMLKVIMPDFDLK